MNAIVKVTGLTVLAATGVLAGLSFGAGPTNVQEYAQAPDGGPSREPAETPATRPQLRTHGSASETLEAELPSETPTPSPTVLPTPGETPATRPPFPTGGSASGTPTVELPPETPGPSPTVPPSPTASPSEITIVGDTDCVSLTREALDLLRESAEDHHDVVVNYVGVIQCAESGSGMYAWEDPPRFQVGRATMEAGAVWYAGSIAHDACHARLYQDYALSHPSSPVPDGVWTGETAEAQCLDVQYEALGQMGASQDTLDYVKAAIDTGYWEVDEGERYW